jgi:hypothetical protein
METAVATTCGYGHQMGAGAYVCPQCGAPALVPYLPLARRPVTTVAARTPSRTPGRAAASAVGHVLAVIGLVCGAVSLLCLPLAGPRLLVPAVLGLACSLSARQRGAALAPAAVGMSALAVAAPMLLVLLP